MKSLFFRLRDTVGLPALAALAAIAVCAALNVAFVRPLEARVNAMEEAAARATRRIPPDGVLRIAADRADQVAAFHRYFDRGVETVDWLGKLHMLAEAQGLDARSADYRLAEPGRVLDRYRMSMPLSGSYAQIRAFLEAALAECPIAALEQVSFRRRASGDPRVDADVTLTLYLPRR